jgi:adenine-specific DNA-methyltransferase
MSSDFTNQVIAGDCLRVLPQIAEASVDLVLTDPPYLLGYRARDGRTICGDRRADWLGPAFEQLFRVLKPDTFCISFYGWNSADLFIAAFRAAGFRIVGHLAFVKPYAASVRFLRHQHEQAYLLAKGRPKEPGAAIADVLEWEYTGNLLHPTQKPLAVILPLVSTFSKPGDLVLDPFAGSGTTLAAAKRLGRRYIGIETFGAGYCKAAQERLVRVSAVS